MQSKIYFRHFFVTIGTVDGSFNPEITEIGPRIDFQLRRNFEAPPAVRAASLRQPRQLRPKKQKNVSRNILDEKIGRIHLGRQNLDSLVLHKGKGLRKRAADGTAGEDGSKRTRPSTAS